MFLYKLLHLYVASLNNLEVVYTNIIQIYNIRCTRYFILILLFIIYLLFHYLYFLIIFLFSKLIKVDTCFNLAVDLFQYSIIV